MRRIRVMRVIARMNVGGPAMQVAGLAEFLPIEEFDQIVLAGEVSASEADFTRLHDLNTSIVRLGSKGRGLNLLRDGAVLLSLIKQIRHFKPDVIHSHTAKAGVLARLAAELSGVKPRLVHTYHGHLLKGYFSPVTLAAVIQTERILAGRTDRLVSVGKQVRDELIARGIGSIDQYVIIPPGLAELPQVNQDMAREQLGLSANDFVVLFMGRLTKIKRLDRLLSAVKIATAQVPELKVLIAGDGELRGGLEAQAVTQGLPIRFLGWRNDLGVLLGAADCVVLSSDNEGTPVSLIQAAQVGVAVVATDVGSVSEVVESNQTGILTSLTPEAIAEALVLLAQDPGLRAQLGARAQVLAKDRYGYGRLAADHARLYRDLMRRKP